MVVKCDWSTLNSQELRELRQADIVDKDELLEAYEKALEYCEIEKKQTKKVMKERVKKLEKEKEQETTRVKELEKEMEELKRLVEKTEKEKGEVKQGEMDKDGRAEEAKEYDRQVGKEERDKEGCCNHAGTLNTFIRGIRLRNSTINVSVYS